MGLFSSHYFSAVHQGLVYAHVLGALLSLVVAPIAMIVHKGGRAHRRWGKLYFWGMFVTNGTAFVLLTYRFNVFLLGVTVISLYGAFAGYRALYRKRLPQGQQATWLDWGVTSLTLLAGLGLIVWGVLGMLGSTLVRLPLGGDAPLVLLLLPLAFGVAIVQTAVSDIKSYRRRPTDKRWWWYAHMNAMLGSYVGLTTALMVQQVGPRLPEGVAWVVWILPGVLGGVGISYWIGWYRKRFAARQRPQMA